MHWKVLGSWLRTPDQDWIHRHTGSTEHSFDLVTADYAHDRSRANTSGREWRDYLRHAVRGWRAASRTPGPVGIITVFPQLAAMVGLIKRLLFSKRPVIAWAFNLGKKYDGVKGLLATYALRSVDLFVVFSRREIATYADMLGLPPERFVFVPFTEEMVEPQYAEDEQEPFVVALGTANRDYRSLVAAVAELGVATVIIAGPHAVTDLTLPANVVVRSGLSLAECHALSQRARINVVPLDADETAAGQVTVRNGMMFGKAVIATTSIGTEDYIEDGVTGLLVPPRDAAALARAIAVLWNDRERRDAMGAAARRWIMDHAHFDEGPRRLREIVERMSH